MSEFDKFIERSTEKAEELAAGYRVIHKAQEEEVRRDNPELWSAVEKCLTELQTTAALLSKPVDERDKPITELLTNVISDAAMVLAAFKPDVLPSQVLGQLARGTAAVEMELTMASLVLPDVD